MARETLKLLKGKEFNPSKPQKFNHLLSIICSSFTDYMLPAILVPLLILKWIFFCRTRGITLKTF